MVFRFAVGKTEKEGGDYVSIWTFSTSLNKDFQMADSQQ